MQPAGVEHVGFDQIDQRPEHHHARAHQVSHDRQAEIDALFSVALALAIERLVDVILLEQDSRSGWSAASANQGRAGSGRRSRAGSHKRPSRLERAYLDVLKDILVTNYPSDALR